MEKDISSAHGVRAAMAAILVLAFLAPNHVDGSEDGPNGPDRKTMSAVRVETAPPRVDGLLDDSIWGAAPVASGFTQVRPEEGEPATEKTTVQVVYDNDAIYFGIMCHDSEPNRITSRLGRRDAWLETDQVSVNLDPHFDRRTGFAFTLAPSGWKSDARLYNDGDRDHTWDGVWEGEAAIHKGGWSAEYRIPYHVLRFSQKDKYVWGVTVTRKITRKKERVRWVHKTRKDAGWVSKFGNLVGIQGIRPRKSLEVLPYTMGRASYISEDGTGTVRKLLGTGGMDVRYGISPSISLNATINPDFGQVEADPAELNLGVFETFQEERRPFFIEGRTLFRYPRPGIVGIRGPSNLFHSRRIGRRPGRLDTPDGSEVIEKPDGTTIIGAVKIAGKTASKTSIGVLNAVTAEEYATIEETVTDALTGAENTQRRKFRVEPLTNYFAGRVQQDISTNARVGALASAVNGRGFDPAYLGSFDSEVKWRENAYRVFTRLSGSQNTLDDENRKGYEAVGYFSKFGGTFGGQAYMEARSPGFSANALGYTSRNDFVQTGGHFYVQRHDPWILGQESGFNLNVWQHWNYDRVTLRKGVNFNMWTDLKNDSWWNLGINREFAATNDLATRGGPLVTRPAGIEYWVGGGTDDGKPVSVGGFFEGTRDDGGATHEERIFSWIEFRPVSNIQLEISPRYTHTRNSAQWVDNVDDDGDGEDDHFVFGELHSQVFNLVTRGSVCFTPTISAQLYLQSFVSVGDYSAIKELARPRSYSFTPYAGLDENPDFSRRSLKGNFVFRWEYRPGSTLYLVWSQSRDADLELGDPSFTPWKGVRRSFSDEGDNILLLKLNYWIAL